MRVESGAKRCPKCDNRLDLQTDGSTITIDIAHHGERVSDALGKLNKEIRFAKSTTAQFIRLIVGSGLIKEEVMLTLSDLQRRGTVLDYDIEPHNRGAIVVTLKEPQR